MIAAVVAGTVHSLAVHIAGIGHSLAGHIVDIGHSLAAGRTGCILLHRTHTGRIVGLG